MTDEKDGTEYEGRDLRDVLCICAVLVAAGAENEGWITAVCSAHAREVMGHPDLRFPPVERCQTCIHPEGYDRLSGPCPTCDGAGAIPPAEETR